jgi:hypothetical protein
MFAHLARARVGAERGRRRCGRFSFCEWWRRSYGVNVDDLADAAGDNFDAFSVERNSADLRVFRRRNTDVARRADNT